MRFEPIRDMFPASTTFNAVNSSLRCLVGFCYLLGWSRVSVDTGYLDGVKNTSPRTGILPIAHVLTTSSPSQMMRVIAMWVITGMGAINPFRRGLSMMFNTHQSVKQFEVLVLPESGIPLRPPAKRPLSNTFSLREKTKRSTKYFSGLFFSPPRLMQFFRVTVALPASIVFKAPASSVNGAPTVFNTTLGHRV